MKAQAINMKFAQLFPNVPFKFRGELYRKHCHEDRFNAIRLSTGKCSSFAPLTEVEVFGFSIQPSTATIKEFKDYIIQLANENMLVVKELKRLRAQRDDLLNRLSRSTIGEDILTKLNDPPKKR